MIDFFILGNPRSGTTLLRLILSSHSKIVVPPEAGFAVWLYENWSGGYNNELYVSKLLETKKIESWDISECKLIDYLNRFNVSNLKDAISKTYDFFKELKGVNIVGDKNNYYLHHIESLNSISQNAKYIHLIRDGRDVACSYIDIMSRDIKSRYAPKLPVDIALIANEWRDNNRKIREGLVGKRFLTVRLEDIQENPRNKVAEICDFLGVSFEESMLLFYNSEENFEPKEYDGWKLKNKSPIVSDSGRYKEELKSEDLRVFEEIAEDVLMEYEYV